MTPSRQPASAPDRPRAARGSGLRDWLTTAGIAAVAGAVVLGAASLGDLRDTITRAERDAVPIPDGGQVVTPSEPADPSAPDRSGRPDRPRLAVPTCVTAPACFSWMIRLDADTVRQADWVTTHDTIVGVGSTRGVGYDIVTGALRWERDDLRLPGQNYLFADKLLLLHERGGGISAIDLDTGQTRWTLDDVDVRALFDARVTVDGPLLTAASDHDRASSGMLRVRLAGRDAETGALLWERTAEQVSLSRRHAVVIEDGEMALITPDGTEQWRTGSEARPDRVEHAWSIGPVLTVWPAGQLHRVSDGARIEDATGTPMGTDGEAVVLVDDRNTERTVTLWEDGSTRWSVTTDVSCCCNVRLQTAAIELDDCAGASLRLSRADGRQLDRVERDRQEPNWAPTIGPYTLAPIGSAFDPDELALIDRRTSTTLARLPLDAWPLGRVDDHGQWRDDVGGQLVLRMDGWLVALPYPSEDDPDPARNPARNPATNPTSVPAGRGTV